jgi:Flp pilus assembly protein TadB
MCACVELLRALYISYSINIRILIDFSLSLSLWVLVIRTNKANEHKRAQTSSEQRASQRAKSHYNRWVTCSYSISSMKVRLLHMMRTVYQIAFSFVVVVVVRMHIVFYILLLLLSLLILLLLLLLILLLLLLLFIYIYYAIVYYRRYLHCRATHCIHRVHSTFNSHKCGNLLYPYVQYSSYI